MGARLVPLNDRVLIEQFAPEEQTKSGLYIPTQAQEESMDGIVRAIPEEDPNDEFHISCPVKVGDHVVYPKYEGTELKVEGVAYRCILIDKLIGVFRGGEDD